MSQKQPVLTFDSTIGLWSHEDLHGKVLPSRVIGTNDHFISSAIPCRSADGSNDGPRKEQEHGVGST